MNPTIIAKADGIVVARFPANSQQKPYVTTFAADTVQACTCQGWLWRGKCKHAEAVKMLVNEMNRKPPAPKNASECPKAKRIQCVCIRAMRCDCHGTHHTGTHD